jgi:hypothetical protein
MSASRKPLPPVEESPSKRRCIIQEGNDFRSIINASGSVVQGNVIAESYRISKLTYPTCQLCDTMLTLVNYQTLMIRVARGKTS